jgi:hypothetical protein
MYVHDGEVGGRSDFVGDELQQKVASIARHELDWSW